MPIRSQDLSKKLVKLSRLPAVASELTPGILTPVPKDGAGSAITGSVEFTSTTDALVLSAGEDFAYGTGDFTIEAWIQPQGTPSGETKQYLLKLNLVMTTLFLKLIVTKQLKQHLDQPQYLGEL